MFVGCPALAHVNLVVLYCSPMFVGYYVIMHLERAVLQKRICVQLSEINSGQQLQIKKINRGT